MVDGEGDMTVLSRASRAVRRVAGLVVMLSCLASLPALAGTANQAFEMKKLRLSAASFYTMKPFILPILQDGIVKEQFTLVLALELTDSDARDDIYHLVAPLRDALYHKLYQMVTFRRRGSPIPHVDAFKTRLVAVASEIIGTEHITAMVVQQAFKRRAR